ncbi:MAG TPA: ATP-binding protein [Nitrospiraceae bacterium]|jgi:signal transduction histidine kinase|nr:ATP-binding protein [Nitrospiraceae bacterium]
MRGALTSWFRHLTIGQKLVFSFSVMLVVLAFSLAAILVYLVRVNSYVDRHQRITVPAIITAAAMQRETSEMNLAYHLFLERKPPRGLEEAVERLNVRAAAIKKALDLYRSTHAARTHPILYRMLTEHHQTALADQEDAAIRRIDLAVQTLTANWNIYLAAARAAGPASSSPLPEADRLIGELTNGLDQLMDAHVRIDVEMKREGDLLVSRARAVALALVALLALVITATYVLFNKHIAQPLKRLATTADRVAREDLSASFDPWHSKDEVGMLSASLVAMLAALRERTRALERKTKELEAFTYSVAHDLKAPLREIEGFSSLLERKFGGTVDPTALGYAAKIHASALQMTALIDALLRYSRLEQQTMPRVRVDLHALVHAVVSDRLQSVPFPAPAVTVDLPAAAIQGDPAAIRQAVVNLLDNALKFSRGVASPEIRIGGTVTDRDYVLWFMDNGIGFDPKEAERIFGLFERLHAPSEFEGTGVGLAIVKLVMEKHGGRVWAESSPGKGSVFYLAFPMKEEP